MKTVEKFVMFFSLALVVLVLSASCIAPNNAYLMELNRNGKWKEAEKIGQEMLIHRNTFTHSQICETYFHVIYAQTRMGKKEEAIKGMREYDTFSTRETISPELLWLNREMGKLKDELGLLGKAGHTLVSAMKENGNGNYVLARELCNTVISMNDANDIQKATAHFVAAICSIKLKDVENAEIHLAAFDKLKSVLPPDHQTLAEEPYARQGLRELKN